MAKYKRAKKAKSGKVKKIKAAKNTRRTRKISQTRQLRHPKQTLKSTKYIFVTGGMSGLGKGLITSSAAKLLQSMGYNISIIKIDPYVNVDAGTMSPFEHGEVFVTSDGYESDQDLGVYERFLNKNLGKEHNITTGRIYWQVIQKERQGKYLGKTVQIIPHITNEIQDEIKKVAEDENADFCIVEIGGTVGDIESSPFLEAARQLAFHENVKYIHAVFIPESTLKEQKTKIAQHSVQKLREMGIQPNILMTRSETPLNEEARKKLSLFCNVKESNIFSFHYIGEIYRMPLVFYEQDFDKILLKEFGMQEKKANLHEWRRTIEKKSKANKNITIGIVGKYSKLEDSYISIEQALKHCEYNFGININIEWLDAEKIEKGFLLSNLQLDGILVPGGFGARGIAGKIKAIEYARENNIPFLGLCLGFQLAAIEFARNKLGMREANSTEFSKTKNPIIYLLPGQDLNKLGGTMRLGDCECKIRKKSLAHKIYKKVNIAERHRHRYEFNNKYKKRFENAGMLFSGTSDDKYKLGEILELKNQEHPFFLATQYHAEFTSRFEKPSPVFMEFVRACSEGV
ncbi:MAG: CTP synthase (glutamine hydrolyzing) [Nanoarchaeota archaeon]|nr:CTP synthase (glutamine hydrolyzing) [Nanoarchaeota archaeon]